MDAIFEIRNQPNGKVLATSEYSDMAEYCAYSLAERFASPSLQKPGFAYIYRNDKLISIIKYQKQNPISISYP